ncbi:hypothetical protein ACFFRR_000357 [Megaselia abdita]
MILNKWLILIIACGCFAYDENIKVTDFYECEEVFLKSEDVNDVYPISCLWNNQIDDNEVLRIKLYVLGYDMQIRLSDGDDFSKEHHGIYISGNIGNPNWAVKSGIALVSGTTWGPAKEVITTNLTNNFFYTELFLVVTKDGWISLSQHKDAKPFLSKQFSVYRNFPPTHIGFSRSQFVKYARVLFDCPFKVEL